MPHKGFEERLPTPGRRGQIPAPLGLAENTQDVQIEMQESPRDMQDLWQSYKGSSSGIVTELKRNSFETTSPRSQSSFDHDLPKQLDRETAELLGVHRRIVEVKRSVRKLIRYRLVSYNYSSVVSFLLFCAVWLGILAVQVCRVACVLQ